MNASAPAAADERTRSWLGPTQSEWKFRPGHGLSNSSHHRPLTDWPHDLDDIARARLGFVRREVPATTRL
jgi:hypothetical protein